MNISGNFNTTQAEKDAVRDYLNKFGILSQVSSIEKYEENATIADIKTEFINGKILLFEVKEEALNRIQRYNQLGIDYISAFHFKDNVDPSEFKHPKKPNELSKFLNSIDWSKPYKMGKIENSKSQIWLFYCKEHNDYKFLNGYNFKKMKINNFYEYLKNNCEFVVNRKDATQCSYKDNWESATFFVDLDYMDIYLIKSKEELLLCIGNNL